MSAHKNNIGCLRLVFAAFVVIGHALFMFDGNTSHEPLQMLTGRLLMAGVGVDAFFLLSGYLITKSLVRSHSFRVFIERRILRIVPGFVVAYVISVFVIAPALGAKPWLHLPPTILRMMTLQDPMIYPEMDPGRLLFPSINASMWTISYEFRCYLLTAILGALGLLARRRIILAATIVALVLGVLTTYPFAAGTLERLDTIKAIIGHPASAIKLTAAYLVGMSFFLYDDDIRPHLSALVLASSIAIGATIIAFSEHAAEMALVAFGAAPLFWLALNADFGALQKINDKWDISYGTYLYGWPVGVYLLHLGIGTSTWGHVAWNLVISLLLGAASWWGVEKWTKDWVRSRSRRDSVPAMRQAAKVEAS